MSSIDIQPWILPTGIPFADLKGKDLEECVYWLVEAMGGRDLEWRTGGSGGGAADGGRDLEATFYVSSPDGEMEPQRWWIECKGRKGTLEKEEVVRAVTNALAYENLSNLVIVTNTAFSNPTRDWVKTWQKNHSHPRVRLWDRETLERQLSQHPSVVMRLFSEALSPEGLLRIVQERFWNKLEYVPLRALQTLWDNRETLEIGPLERFALIANEFANSSIAERPWAACSSNHDLLDLICNTFYNLLYINNKTISAGVFRGPILAAFSHVILVAIQKCEPSSLADLIIEICRRSNDIELSDQTVKNILNPVLERLSDEMRQICSADCKRIVFIVDGSLEDMDDIIDRYWRGLNPESFIEEKEYKSAITIESLSQPCNVGYELNEEIKCPLFFVYPSIENISEFFHIIKRVSAFRLSQAKTRHAEEKIWSQFFEKSNKFFNMPRNWKRRL
ncbi:restriction endonuclease (plasmid) [Acetobacter orientalis]|uniref:restriction endonuclease n=1 Tax=Acetobacter orientalis TaxID=146474 RepID=UPI00386A9B44